MCSGITSAKPSAFSMKSPYWAANAPPSSSWWAKTSGLTMFSPSPSWRAVSLAIAMWSPVIIFTSLPSAIAFTTVSAVSWRGGSYSESTPRNSQLESSRPFFVRATPSVRKPRAAYSSTTASTRARISLSSTRSQITCGDPFDTEKTEPSGPHSVASVRLRIGSKGTNFVSA